MLKKALFSPILSMGLGPIGPHNTYPTNLPVERVQTSVIVLITQKRSFQSFWTPFGPIGPHNTYPSNLPVEHVQTSVIVLITQKKAFSVILDSIGPNRTSQHISDKLTGETCLNCCKRRFYANQSVSSHFRLHWAQ